jgi:DNA-binding transcriptional MerR regulator
MIASGLRACAQLPGKQGMKTVTTATPSKALRTTSTVCKAANVTRGQLRLYEDEGLIAPQSRTEAGYRQYGEDTLDRLKAIALLKELGLTLAEIGLLLSDRDHGVLDDQAIQRLASEALSNIDARIARLQFIRGYVAPVAMGDLGVLKDDDCNFVVEFLSALSAGKTKRRA